jgi:hypothetical protein
MKTLQLTILQPSDGYKLLNESLRLIAGSVQLAPTASADDWREITTEEAEALQAEWDKELQDKLNAQSDEPATIKD